MKMAYLLLQELTKQLPPGEGQHHALVWEDAPAVVLFQGERWHTFYLEDEDMEKPPAQIADEIKALLNSEVSE